ncbi:hypothetical protein [Corynebacterium auris]|uniref:hypothetical protein n=1 Tax=Corynebacterium auris TaxID=44750 RepID=UPI0025B5E2B1|nr:hypothetical protein [Corynebacterium auris]WJY68917.1 hypothetical protein CAURIS_10220 [Corynebacterium auris]
MSLDMSSFLPAGLPDDWTPATFGNLDAATVTFTTDSAAEVREFDSALAAMFFVREIVGGFDYSPTRNAVRTQRGDVILLPVVTTPRARVPASECTLTAAGHCPHWGPMLKAGNGPAEDWVPVSFARAEGALAELVSPTGIIAVYFHDAAALEGVTHYNPRWKVVRGEVSAWVSGTPITPCTA